MKNKLLLFLGLLLFVFNINSVSADWSAEMRPKELTLNVGEKGVVMAVETGDINVNTLPTYTSSDPSVATVDNKGNVEALKPGTTIITGKYGTLVAGTTKVTVNGEEEWKAEVTPKELSLKIGGTGKITVKQTGSIQVNTLPSFTSNNTGVATVDSNGNVKGIKAGTATVTVKYGTLVAGTATITVSSEEEDWKAEVTPKELSLKVGGTGKITARQTGSTQVNTLPTYTSNNTSVATVDSNGNVKGIRVGTTTITVKYGTLLGGTATITVTADEEEWKAEVTPKELSLKVGGTGKITARQTGSTQVNTLPTYTSNNTGVATVDKNGNVKGVKAGTATITVKYGNLVAGTTKVTVTSQEVQTTETPKTQEEKPSTTTSNNENPNTTTNNNENPNATTENSGNTGTTNNNETIGETIEEEVIVVTPDENNEEKEELGEEQKESKSNVVLYIIIIAGVLLVVSCTLVIIGKKENRF